MKKVILGLLLVIIISIFAVTAVILAVDGPETTKTEVVSKTEETETDYEDENDIPYKYPITVKSEEWKTLTMDEKIKLCEVPEDQLKSLSTLALFKTIVDYPYFFDIYAYDTYVLGFECSIAELSTYKELIGREDLAQVILAEYKKTDLRDFINETYDISKDDVFYKYIYVEFMEYLLTLKDVHNNLSDKEKEELSDLAFKNYKLKIGNSFFSSGQDFIYRVAYISGTIDSFGKIESESDNDFRLNTPSGIVDVNKMYNPK